MQKRCELAALCVALGCHNAPPPQAPPVAATPVAAPPALASGVELARGRYLAQIAGCTTCHGSMLAGGMEMKLPNGGVVRMPNITADVATGVGKWSASQIEDAIRRGVRPDGARLAPIMPYPYYDRMTDGDVAALVSWMRALPPVKNPVARSENLGMEPVVVEVASTVDRTDDPHAHGEYLAQLMHCGACHTPRQGAFANQTFAGGNRFYIGPNKTLVVAPNVTSDRDTGIGTWGEGDIIHAVRDMQDPAGNALREPMAMYKDAWAQLTDADAHALATYVKSIPAVHHDTAAEGTTVSRTP